MILVPKKAIRHKKVLAKEVQQTICVETAKKELQQLYNSLQSHASGSFDKQ
jgi:hypothetical protein